MLHYTDWSIGQFMERFKKRSDYDDTFFIITADHAMAHFQSDEPYERFLIPLLIHAPKHIQPEWIPTYGSQIDLLSTIIELLDLEGTYSSIGSNLFEKKTDYVVVKEGALINIYSPRGFLQHSLERTVNFQTVDLNQKEKNQQDLEKQAIAFDHLMYLLLNTNRLNRL